MTLVVARVSGHRVAVVSDTRLTKHDVRLPIHEGVVKSYILPGGICASFSNSPELAVANFKKFAFDYPQGANFADTISFFEKASAESGNDYLIAFSRQAKLAKIVDGRRMPGMAKTQWIGDKVAYERFREFETKARKGVEAGRAVNAVLFETPPQYIGTKIELRHPTAQPLDLWIYENDQPVVKIKPVDPAFNSNSPVTGIRFHQHLNKEE